MFGRPTAQASCKLAAQKGRYPSYTGSPISEGRLQPDLWGVTPSSRWDWAALRADIATHGVRNSLLVAPMPTASTSQVRHIHPRSPRPGVCATLFRWLNQS